MTTGLALLDKAAVTPPVSPAIAGLRRQAGARFRTLGLPSRRLEAWRYTDLGPLAGLSFGAPAACAVFEAARVLAGLPPLVGDAFRLVFVDGRLRFELSHPVALSAGISITSLANALRSDPDRVVPLLGRVLALDGEAMPALNTALMAEGVVVSLGASTRLERPLELLFLAGEGVDAVAHHPRALIVLEAGSTATVIERHIGIGGANYLSNQVTEISLGAGAHLRHYKVQAEGAGAFHLARTGVRAAADAVYESFVLATGARLARHETSVRLEGPGARAVVCGAYLIRGQQHCDNTTVIEHAASHTVCQEVFKGVVDEAARAVFQGKIVVGVGAQKADGRQVSKALLLSDTAEIDQKPELEIYADDVKCSHGATAGQVDRNQLFYLQSRGLPEATARRLLIEGFLAEAFEQISHLCVRETLLEQALAWLRT